VLFKLSARAELSRARRRFEIGEVGHVTLHCSDAAADRRYRLVQDVDERAFFNEALGDGETFSAAATSDEGNFSL
jgi:hypothetical protein